MTRIREEEEVKSWRVMGVWIHLHTEDDLEYKEPYAQFPSLHKDPIMQRNLSHRKRFPFDKNIVKKSVT